MENEKYMKEQNKKQIKIEGQVKENEKKKR